MKKLFAVLMLFVLLLVLPASAQDVCVRDSIFPDAGNCGYDVQDYQMNMAWDKDGDQWTVSEVITFISEWDTDELWFDFTDTYEITSLSIDGQEAEYDRQGTKLIVHHNFAHDTEYKLNAVFSGKLLWGEIFDPEGTGRTPDEGFCMLNEPTNAWRFYICNDHPKDKATYHYSFTVPASFVPAGSGDLLKIEEATGTVIFPGKSFERDYDPGTNEGTVTFTYALETQTAPYLFTVCAGAFDLKLQTFDTGRVQLDFVDINHKDASHAWELTGLQEEIIAFLEPFFGKYPYTNSGAIVFHTEMGAALETLGRSLYDASTTEDFVFAHEITHQWMGDLISLEDWSDLWIKEGAATFGELLWAEHKDGRKAYEDEVILNYKTVVSHGSSGPKEIHSNQPDDLYSAGPYKGGSLVYHILRDRLGDEVFSKALQTLIEENKYGTVNEEKFIEVFSRVSGEDLTDLIKSFLYYGENGHVPDLPGLITYEEAMKEYEESTKKEV